MSEMRLGGHSIGRFGSAPSSRLAPFAMKFVRGDRPREEAELERCVQLRLQIPDAINNDRVPTTFSLSSPSINS